MIIVRNYLIIILPFFLLGASKSFAMQRPAGHSSSALQHLETKYNFSWVQYKDARPMGGMAEPLYVGDIVMLEEELGVGGLVTLSHERLSSNLFEGSMIQNIHIPLEYNLAPTLMQVNDFYKFVSAVHSTGKKVVVHCDRGNARVSTFLILYLLGISRSGEKRLSVQEAMAIVAEYRPGSLPLEDAQKAFLETLDVGLLNIL